jgi:cytochrome c553
MKCSHSAAIPALVFSVAARGQEAGSPAVSSQELQGKIQFCSTCHGPSGQGFHGAFPIPRLAGQQVEYIENQLLAFYEGRRSNKFMFNVSHQLSPPMRTALAKHFSCLNPKPYGNPPKELVPAGKKSMKREFLMPMFLHGPPVTNRTRKVTGNFLVWQVSITPTSKRHWRILKKCGVKILQKPDTSARSHML